MGGIVWVSERSGNVIIQYIQLDAIIIGIFHKFTPPASNVAPVGRLMYVYCERALTAIVNVG